MIHIKKVNGAWCAFQDRHRCWPIATDKSIRGLFSTLAKYKHIGTGSVLSRIRRAINK